MSDPARPHRLTALLLALLAAAVVAVAGCGGSGDDGGASGKDGSDGGVFARIPHIVDEVQPATVAVLARLPEGRAEGSGVVYDSDGIVVTNNHVVEDATRVTVALASGKRVAAKVGATAPREDLAVLKVDRKLPAAKFEQELPRVGELSVALGNPLGSRTRSPPASSPGSTARSRPAGGRRRSWA